MDNLASSKLGIGNLATIETQLEQCEQEIEEASEMVSDFSDFSEHVEILMIERRIDDDEGMELLKHLTSIKIRSHRNFHYMSKRLAQLKEQIKNSEEKESNDNSNQV